MTRPPDPDPAGAPSHTSFAERLRAKYGEGVDPEVSIGGEAASIPGSEPGTGTSELLKRLSEHGVKSPRYQLKGEIARGGMGAILRVWDEDLRRHLAMKVVLGKGDGPGSGGTPQVDTRVLARFLEEAQVTGQLDHPGIVPVHELGLDQDGRVYFTMKLVKGRDLKAIFDLVFTGKEDWNETRALTVILRACEAVAYAHKKSVIHRDLKPANIMVGNFGEVFVMDWGLARVLGRKDAHDIRIAPELSSALASVKTERRQERERAESRERGESHEDSSDSPILTMDGEVMGTPVYMAPEQARGETERLGPRSDVYSMGALLYHLLARRPPYVPAGARVTNRMVLQWVLEGPPKPLHEVRAHVPAELAAIVEKAMAREAERRYADTLALAEDLRAYLEHRVVSAYEAGAVAELKKWVQRNKPLAASIVTVLLLSGGSLYWISHDRARRAEQTRVAVEAAYDESIEFGQAGKPAEALASARRALSLAQSGEADAALLERARSFVDKAELAVDAAEREHSLREQDEQLRKRLVDLRLQQIEVINNPRREGDLDAAFARAFQAYGVNLEGADIVPALNRIRERKIAEEIALALDDWGRLRRRVHGPKSEKAENLLYLAMDLDPDSERLRMRKAIFDNDLPTMLELAAPENLPRLAPGSIWVLSATLWDRYPEHRPEVYLMYEQALHLYPGDFVLQSIGGNIYNLVGRNEEALVCRMAAVCLRPDDATSRLRLQDSLFYTGRLTEAEGAARANVAAYPENAEAHYNLGMVEMQLGDHAGALASVARSLELVDDPSRHADLVCLQFRAGQRSQAEVTSALAYEVDELSIATYMHALLDHPDSAQRAPDIVLKALEENPAARDAEWRWVVETVARVCLEDWPGARAALGDHFTPPSALILSPGAYDFLRALIYAHLDRAEAAKDCYARGMANWQALTGGNPAAWERSDVMRWRREAEAALAR